MEMKVVLSFFYVCGFFHATNLVGSISPDDLDTCRNGQVLEDHSLKGGAKAGYLNKLGKADTMDECVELCCKEESCKLALYLKQTCISVECFSDDSCKTISVQHSTYKPLLFFKPEAKAVKPVKMEHHSSKKTGSGFCSTFSARGYCQKAIAASELIYYSEFPSNTERKLKPSLSYVKRKFSTVCKKYAVQAFCHTVYPHCENKDNPKPSYLCKETCLKLENNYCAKDFQKTRNFNFMAYVMPNCSQYNDDRDCVKIKFDDEDDEVSLPGSSEQQDTTKQTEQRQEALTQHDTPLSDMTESEQSSLMSKLNSQQTRKLPETKTPESASTPLQTPESVSTRTQTPESMSTPPQTSESVSTRTQTSESVSTRTQTPENVLAPPQTSEADTKNPEILNHSLDEGTQDQASNGTKHQGDFDENNFLSDNTNQETLQKESAHTFDNELGEAESRNDIRSSLKPVQEMGKITKQLSENEKSALNGLNKDDVTNTDLTSPFLDATSQQTRPDVSRSSENDTIKATSSATTDAKGSLTEEQNGLKESLGLLEPASDVSAEENSEVKPTIQPTTQPKQQSTHIPVKSSTLPPTKSPFTETDLTDEINLEENSTTPTIVTKPQSTHPPRVTTHPTNKPKPSSSQAPSVNLQVSAGENKKIILPQNRVSLYASAWPKAPTEHSYTYHWQQLSAPEGSHGYMEGQNSVEVTLSQLDQVGVYMFKVTVTDDKNAFGFAFVNVTVLPAPRVNKPPRADISPKEQVVTLPTNEVVLDGSKSSDDDKIVQYKWEEVKGPLNDESKVVASGTDSPILQLKNLVPGVYTFKLTVTDSDGEEDATSATITVNAEKDYPPVARAGNDVVIQLPVNYVTLYGNGSTDDKGIVSYEWSKSPASPAVGDLQGTSSPILKASNLAVGDYSFILKVTDTGGETAISKVTVVVKPEKNLPPVAESGSDKDLLFPDDSTTLDASSSTDDQKIENYHWERISGPDSVEMQGQDEKIVHLSKLVEGHYVFKLTVTDEKGLTGTDTVAVNVKRDINKPPVSNAGPDVEVHLPNRAAELDGSKSTDDQRIASYLWTRDLKSPAAGDVINGSDHQPVLRLSNLVRGVYKFTLLVTDGKGLQTKDTAVLSVKEDANSAHLVELYLDVDITKFSEENKEQLVRKLAVILNVLDTDIVVEHIRTAGDGNSVMVMFYVKDPLLQKGRDGQEIAEVLKQKIENEEGFFEFKMLKVEPYICRNNCSGHGFCDHNTKMCICESFWMHDFFKANFGARESNCDWSILYVTVIIFGIIMGTCGLIWGICFCMGRKRVRSRKRHKYAILDDEDDDDDDKTESMDMLPRGAKLGLNSSLLLTDSDEDSDEETTLYEAKKKFNGSYMNGGSNGIIKRDHS